jgi:trigger factor
MAALRTKVEELPESRVRLEVEVPEEDVKHAIEHAASDLADSLRIPGFRKGKVPIPVVLARVGRDALWQEAVRSHLDSWFWSAAESSGIRPVANPEVELAEAPGDGSSFQFTATVAVLPTPELPDWTTLEIGVPEPDVPSSLVDAEIDALRATVAELVPAERPVQDGDTVILDVGGSETHRDYVVEVGGDRLTDEIDSALVGMSAGETKTVELEVAEGGTEPLEITVKEIKEKLLPEADDELARAASEFDTLAELRDDIESRFREQLRVELEARFREDAVDALAAATPIDEKALAPLVEQRASELLSAFARSLEQRGISVQTYLAATGQPQEQIVARMREQADRSVRREVVLDAVAATREIEVSDEEVEELVRKEAAEAEDDAEAAITLLRERGGFERLRADLRLKKALDEVVAGVKRIPVELALAREKLWTPEKEKGGTEMKIWTPGSEEAR